MIPGEYITVAALGAGVLSKHHHRCAALAFGYAAVYLIWNLFIGTPSTFSHIGYDWWFVACAIGESAIIVVAWIINAPSSRYIAVLSTVSVVANILVGALYKLASHFWWAFDAYPSAHAIYTHLIPLVEILQVVTLYLWSWPVVWLARKGVRKYRQHKEGGYRCQSYTP